MMKDKSVAKENFVTIANMLKFILGSAFGVFMFLVPIPHGDSFTTMLDFIKNFIKAGFGASLPYVLLTIVTTAAVMSTYDYLCKPAWIRQSNFLSKAFVTSPFYLVSKIVGAVITVLVIFKLGPDWVTSIDTGATMIDLCNTLLCIVIGFSFLLPFLTDCGIMEFLGVIMRPVVRPLFNVPGRASVDLIASWFGASNAAVILTREQYMKGFYTKREAAYIMTNFSVVSIPFCLLIANTIKISNLFPQFYLCICVVGVALAVICGRIPPLSTIPDTYREVVGKKLNEDVPEDVNLINYALQLSCKRANDFGLKGVFLTGLEVVVGMFFDLIPIVISWGTVMLIIATYTPVFQILSYPMGVYLQMLGVAEAFAVAPATLIGFADMFIPALLMGSIQSVETKFIVGVLSLIQIIYLTEVGAIAIKSEVPLSFTKLLIIFLERTIIAIPLIVLLAKVLL